MPKWRQPIRVFFLLLGLLLFSNIVAPPAAEALLIGTKQEIEIGKGVANDLEKKYGLVNDPALQARVARLGASIVAVSDRKDLPYTFKVLNSKEVNALAVPGGYIYLFKGLIDYMPWITNWRESSVMKWAISSKNTRWCRSNELLPSASCLRFRSATAIARSSAI